MEDTSVYQRHRKRLARNLLVENETKNGPGSQSVHERLDFFSLHSPEKGQSPPSVLSPGSQSVLLSALTVVSSKGDLPAIDFLAGVDAMEERNPVASPSRGPGSRRIVFPNISVQPVQSSDEAMVVVPRVAHPMFQQ
jgi:hypothetical protein